MQLGRQGKRRSLLSEKDWIPSLYVGGSCLSAPRRPWTMTRPLPGAPVSTGLLWVVPHIVPDCDRELGCHMGLHAGALEASPECVWASLFSQELLFI